MGSKSMIEWQTKRNRLTSAKYLIEDEIIELEQRTTQLAGELETAEAELASKAIEYEKVSASLAAFQKVPRPSMPASLFSTGPRMREDNIPQHSNEKLFQDDPARANATVMHQDTGDAATAFSATNPKNLEPLNEHYRTVLYEISESGEGAWKSFFCGRCGANARQREGRKDYFAGIKGITAHVKTACANWNEQYTGEKGVLAECERKILSAKEVAKLRSGEVVDSVAMVFKVEKVAPSIELGETQTEAGYTGEDLAEETQPTYRRDSSATEVTPAAIPSPAAGSTGFEYDFVPRRRVTMGEKRYRDLLPKELDDEMRRASEGELEERPVKQPKMDKRSTLLVATSWQPINSPK